MLSTAHAPVNASGETNQREPCRVDPENPTRVGVLMDIPDMDAVMAALETHDDAATMEHDGVIAESVAVLVEA